MQQSAWCLLFTTNKFSCNYLLRVLRLGLLNGQRESHVVRFLLGFLGIGLLSAHGQGKLELQLLFSMGLRPVGSLTKGFVQMWKFPGQQPPIKKCSSSTQQLWSLWKLANLFWSSLLFSLIIHFVALDLQHGLKSWLTNLASSMSGLRGSGSPGLAMSPSSSLKRSYEN